VLLDGGYGGVNISGWLKVCECDVGVVGVGGVVEGGWGVGVRGREEVSLWV